MPILSSASPIRRLPFVPFVPAAPFPENAHPANAHPAALAPKAQYNRVLPPLLHTVMRPVFFLIGISFLFVRPAISEQLAVPNPLTLEQAYDLTLASDQNVRIAFLALKKADLLPISALTKITPRLNGSYSYSRSSTAADRTAGSIARSDIGNGELSVTLRQPLLDLSVFPARRRGKIQIASAQLARQFTIRETLFGVAASYYEVLKQERLLAVNRQALELASQQEDLSQKRADVGEVTRTDVLRAQVTVETARRALISSENALELQRNTLRNILNLAPDAPLHLLEPAAYEPSERSFEDLLQQAWQKREDLRERALAIKDAEERRNEIRAQYAPTLNAEVDRSLARNSGTNYPGRSDSWFAGVTVNVPVFTGGQREIDLASSRYDQERVTLEKETLGKNIEAEVRQAWLGVRALNASLRAVNVQIQAAEQGYIDLQNQYRAGTAKSVDVLSALKDLNSVRSDLTSLTFDYQVALRSLEQVTGTFQEPRVQSTKVK